MIDSNIPDVALVGDKADIKGARIGEATLLVRYQGKFATVPVTVLNPKPGFAWKQLAAEQLHRSGHRRQTPAAEDPAFAEWWMTPVPAARVAGSDRAIAETRTRFAPSWTIRRRRRSSAAALIDKLIGSSAFIDHWTLEVGRSAAGQSKVSRRKRRIRVPRVDSRIVAAEQALRQDGARDADRRAAAPTRIRRRITSASRAIRSRPWRRRRRCSWASAWCARNATTIRSSAGPRTSITRWPRFSRRSGIRPGYEVGEEIVYDQRADYDMKHPKDGRVMNPQFHRAGHTRSQHRRPFHRTRTAAWRRGMADGAGQSVLRQIHRQPRVELLLRARHHRSGGRYPGVESAQQSGAAGRADQGFHRSQFRSAASDARPS